MRCQPTPANVKNTNPAKQTQWNVSDIYIISAWGRGRGSPRLQEGGGVRLLIENPGGGVLPGEGGARGWEGVCGELGFFLGGGKFPPSRGPAIIFPLLHVGSQESVLKVLKRGPFHAAIRTSTKRCDSCAQGALGRRAPKVPGLRIFSLLNYESESERISPEFNLFRKRGLLLWLVRAQHDHYEIKSERKSG